MAGDDFLSRWSRRKREVAQDAVPPSPAETAEQPAQDARSHDAGALAGEDGLTDEAIAALPSIDSLTAETDLTQFLRAGVPQVLRNAALRRMWSVDPGIRDYLSEAREYAFDWHIPGAVPGTGPMLPTDDIAGMVREIFAGSKPAVAEPGPADPDADHAGSDPVAPVPAEQGHDLPVPDRHPALIAAEATPFPPDSDEKALPGLEAEPAGTAREGAPVARLRRHGGASPI